MGTNLHENLRFSEHLTNPAKLGKEPPVGPRVGQRSPAQCTRIEPAAPLPISPTGKNQWVRHMANVQQTIAITHCATTFTSFLSHYPLVFKT